MKKMFTILLSLALMMSLAVPALATESAQMTISASQSSAYPGNTVTFTVSISSVDDCRSGGIVISYDASVFEFVSGKCLVSGAAMSDFSGGTGVFAFSEGAGISGNIFQFTLKIKATASAGTYRISGSPSVRTGSGEISCGISGASVTVSCDHAYGGWSNAGTSHQRICSKCGGTESVAHTWDAGTVTKAATCKEEGAMTYTCTACGATTTESIAKTDDHTWGGCTKADDSSHKHTCSVCGKEESSKHSWTSGKVTKAATCKEEGAMTYTCTVCGATTTESIAKTDDHTWGGCAKADDSSHKQTCTRCGKERTAMHSWDKGTVEKAATCRESGKLTYTCTGCGATKTETTPATGEHSYDNACDSDCNGCGAARTAAHTYGAEWSSDETGHWHGCAVCGEQDTLTAHEFENDCAVVCLICGYVRETAHVYGDWQCDEASHWQECTRCGDASEVQSHIPGGDATEETAQVCTLCAYELAPALGHSFREGWSGDEESHWHECACGERADHAAHTWDEGREDSDRSVTYTCTACAVQRTEEPQGLAPELQMALIAMAAALAGGVIGYLIPRKKR